MVGTRCTRNRVDEWLGQVLHIGGGLAHCLAHWKVGAKEWEKFDMAGLYCTHQLLLFVCTFLFFPSDFCSILLIGSLQWLVIIAIAYFALHMWVLI